MPWGTDVLLDEEPLSAASCAPGRQPSAGANAVAHLRYVSLSYLSGGRCGRDQVGFGADGAISVPPLSPVPELLLGERALQYASCYEHVCRALVDLAGAAFTVLGPKRSSDSILVGFCFDFSLSVSVSHRIASVSALSISVELCDLNSCFLYLVNQSDPEGEGADVLPDWLQTLVICACFMGNCFRLKSEALGALLNLLAIAQRSTPAAPLAHSPADTPSPSPAPRTLPTSEAATSASATPPEAASLRGSKSSQQVDSKDKEKDNSQDASVADATNTNTAPPDLLRNTSDAVQPQAQQSQGTGSTGQLSSGAVSTISITFESVSHAQLDFLRHRSAFYFVSFAAF